MNRPFESFTLHRFRGLQEVQLAGLGQVNLLVGENNSGKTSVLEALSVYCDPLNFGTWVRVPGRRESTAFSAQRLAPIERLLWLFPQQRSRPGGEPLYLGNVRLSAMGTFPIRNVYAQCREVRGMRPVEQDPYENSPGDAPEEFEERRGMEISLNVESAAPEPLALNVKKDVFTFWDEAFFRFNVPTGGLPCRLIGPHDHVSTALPVRQFSEARLGGFREAILKLLQLFDPRISGIEVLAPHGRSVLYLQHADAGLVPLNVFGDGMRRAMLIALALPGVAGGVLLIDEVEAAIHVSALSKVFRWMLDACKELGVQLFLTTHSLEAIDAILAADTTEEEDIVGYRLERVGEQIVAKRFGESLMKQLRYERGLDVR